MEGTVFREIIDNFDVQDMKNKCNHKGCPNPAEKRAVIYKYHYKTGRKDLAELFLCESHIKSIDMVIRNIKNKMPELMLDKEVSNI